MKNIINVSPNSTKVRDTVFVELSNCKLELYKDELNGFIEISRELGLQIRKGDYVEFLDKGQLQPGDVVRTIGIIPDMEGIEPRSGILSIPSLNKAPMVKVRWYVTTFEVYEHEMKQSIALMCPNKAYVTSPSSARSTTGRFLGTFDTLDVVLPEGFTGMMVNNSELELVEGNPHVEHVAKTDDVEELDPTHVAETAQGRKLADFIDSLKDFPDTGGIDAMKQHQKLREIMDNWKLPPIPLEDIIAEHTKGDTESNHSVVPMQEWTDTAIGGNRRSNIFNYPVAGQTYEIYCPTDPVNPGKRDWHVAKVITVIVIKDETIVVYETNWSVQFYTDSHPIGTLKFREPSTLTF